MGPTLAAGYWFRAAQTAGKGGRAVKYNQKPGAVDVLDARSLPGTRPGKRGQLQGVLRPVQVDGSAPPLSASFVHPLPPPPRGSNLPRSLDFQNTGLECSCLAA